MEKDILLIGADNLSMYQETCKDIEVEIRTSSDLKSTMDAINEKKPDLFLVDYEVLGKQSEEISQTLKKYPGTSYIPLLFVVPRDCTDELLEVLFIPINDYVFLPLDADDLQLRLRAQLGLIDLKGERKLVSVEEKIEELEKLIKIFPNYNAGWEELAGIYEKAGKIEEALESLLKLSKEYYHQNNFGLAMDTISRMKTVISKQSMEMDNYAQFMESVERCLNLLKS